MISTVALAIIQAFALSVAPSATAQSPKQSHFQQTILANSLDLAGKPPFHIRIAFQLYSLIGDPSDSGFIEEWWAAPGVSRVTVTSVSLKTADPVLLNDELAMDPREKFLVRKLLAAVLHPIQGFDPPFIASAKESPQTFDKTTLTCFTLQGEQISGTGLGSSKFCTDPVTYGLRMELEGPFSTTAHNDLGLFHDTHVSTAIEIAYVNRKAISGKVVTLQRFDSAKSAIVLTSGPAEQEDKASIVPGKILTRIKPDYPAIAKAGHIAGVVILHAVISKEGPTKDIFVLGCQSPALTQAAVDAVQRWTYKPFTRDGRPVDVDTIISVNFQFGGG